MGWRKKYTVKRNSKFFVLHTIIYGKGLARSNKLSAHIRVK
jgi:hypothetical protein